MCQLSGIKTTRASTAERTPVKKKKKMHLSISGLAVGCRKQRWQDMSKKLDSAA